MSDFLDAFAAAFTDDMPGVVSMSWSSGEGATAFAHVHYFAEMALDSEGYTQIQRRAYRVVGLSAAIGHFRRGDTVNIDGRDYRCVSNANHDGFGVAEIHLESVTAS